VTQTSFSLRRSEPREKRDRDRVGVFNLKKSEWRSTYFGELKVGVWTWSVFNWRFFIISSGVCEGK